MEVDKDVAPSSGSSSDDAKSNLLIPSSTVRGENVNEAFVAEDGSLPAAVAPETEKVPLSPPPPKLSRRESEPRLPTNEYGCKADMKRRLSDPQVVIEMETGIGNHLPHRVQFDEDETEDEEGDDISTTSNNSSSSSSSSSSSARSYEARPPDGGYGWVVVFASFMVNMIADGITFSFGVIFREFLKYFGEGKSKTAWIGSLFTAIPLLSGPFASYLTDRYGCRKVSIVGGLLAASGFILSAFANSLEVMFLTFGILSGFGLSLCYVAAIVIVAYYFEKRRSLATGLSVCGSGIGTFVFPPLIQHLIDEYGWRGATLIMAGMFLHLCVFGAMMRDLDYIKEKKRAKKLSNPKRRKKKMTKRTTTPDISFPNGVNHHHHTHHNAAFQHQQSLEEFKKLLHSRIGDSPTKGAPSGSAADEGRRDGSAAGSEEGTSDGNRMFSSLVNLPTFVSTGENVPMEVWEGLSTNKHLYSVLLQNYPSLGASRSISDSGINSHQQKRMRGRAGTSLRPADEGVSRNESGASPESKVSEGVETEVREDGTKVTKKKSILKKTCSTKRSGLASNMDNAPASPWWTKRYTVGGNESPRIPTAFLRDLKVHRHSLTYRGAMLNINRYRLRASSCPDIYRNSMTTINEEKTEWYDGLRSVWHVFTDMMDFSYFRNLGFTLFAISNFLLYTWYDVPYVYLADHAVEQGKTEKDAIFMISIVGILNMLGEVVLGWAGDRPWLNPRLVYSVCMALCGISVGVIPVLTEYLDLCVASGMFGLFIAANYSLTSIILVELITLEEFTNAYGLLLLVQGVANLLGPPLAGWLYDITGSYDLPFYLAGFFITLSGILLELESMIKLFKRWTQLEEHQDNETNRNSNDCDKCTYSNGGAAVIA